MKKSLIVHVGNKYSRAIKSIEHVKPDLVYFIYSKDYEKYKDSIINECYHPFIHKSRIIDDFQSIDEIYSVSKEIFKELNCKYKIYVGVSNGTKAMVAGLSLASVGYDCEFLYVGSTPGGRDSTGTGEVLPGHEAVLSEFHPMSKQAFFEINRAKRYFNDYKFDDALIYFKQAEEVLDDKKRVQMYIKITHLFKYWDKFENFVRFSDGKKLLIDYYLRKKILVEINTDEDLSNYFVNEENEFLIQLEKNFKFLDKKISKKGLIKENDIYYYLVDLINNAYRRIKEEKFDDATARLYRISELIAQIRLLEMGFIDKKILKDNKVFHIDKTTLIETKNVKAIEYAARKPDFQNSEEKRMKFSLKDSFTLLEYLDDSLAKEFLEDKKVDNALSSRNNSILAHGLNPANKDDTLELFNKLNDYAREVFPELDEYLDYATFPKFMDMGM